MHVIAGKNFFQSFGQSLLSLDNQHLIIFVKNPVLGRVKTRLAASVGNQKALDVYLRLMEITRVVSEKLDCTRHLFYSDEIESDAWDDDKFNKHVQEGKDLGERMSNAFEKVFALGAKKAIIIGSDCPEITTAIINYAFESLNTNDVCIGPARDGGYYLLGMNRPLPFLFEKKAWSTDSVFSSTIEDLSKQDVSFGKLQELSDLDTSEDLTLLK